MCIGIYVMYTLFYGELISFIGEVCLVLFFFRSGRKQQSLYCETFVGWY
jgi:hypothetical protein